MGLAIQPENNSGNRRDSSSNGPQGTRGFEMSLSSLKTQQKHRNLNQIICYARKYSYILETGDASVLTSLTGPQRRHAMEALTVLSKLTGCYDSLLAIRKRYSLHWTDGNESLRTLQRFFDEQLTLDAMIQRIKEMIEKLPPAMAKIIKFAVVTGL